MNKGENERPVSGGIGDIFPVNASQNEKRFDDNPTESFADFDEAVWEQDDARGNSGKGPKNRRDRKFKHNKRRANNGNPNGEHAEKNSGERQEKNAEKRGAKGGNRNNRPSNKPDERSFDPQNDRSGARFFESSEHSGAKPSDNDDYKFDETLEFHGAGGFDDNGRIIPESKESSEVVMTTSSPETVEVVGVRFRNSGKTYFFSPNGLNLKKGDRAIVDTSRGIEFCTVHSGKMKVPATAIVPPLRKVVRAATEEDQSRYEENLRKEKESFAIGLEKIREHKLEMKLIDAEYTLDQTKLTFYFSAEGRVDFRELVKDLAGVFRTRIELRQIGIRDEAKLVGGLGVCGQPFCCSTFLSDFAQVSIKMAKEQNLSLNAAKISGSCGRLMCCLRFENESYKEEKKFTPAVGAHVNTADGAGVVVDSAPLLGKVKVRFGDEANSTVREYRRENVTLIPRENDAKNSAAPAEAEIADDGEGVLTDTDE